YFRQRALIDREVRALQRLLHPLACPLVRQVARITQLVRQNPPSHVTRYLARGVSPPPVSYDEAPVREVREKTVLVPRADHSGMSALTYLELHACPINVRGELRQSPPPRLPRSRTAATTADAG